MRTKLGTLSSPGNTRRHLRAVLCTGLVAVSLLTTVRPVTVAATACTVTTKLAPKTRSADVVCLERRLRALGYPGIGTPNAYYGASSITAVRRFQLQRGLYPDGIVTSITARELGLRGQLPTAAGTARVTVLGDSTSAAMRWYDEARNTTSNYDVMGNKYDLVWSLESCRRLVAASCVGRVDPGSGHRWRPVSVLPMMRSHLNGRLGEALVIMAGYDDVDIAPAIDLVMAEANRQRVPHVYWLTYRTSTSYGYARYYLQHNRELAAAKVRYPTLTVLDWNAFTRSQSTTTQRRWFEADDIHMTRLGGFALATWLRASIVPAAIERCTTAKANAGTLSTTVGTLAPAANGGGFEAVAPTRLVDTRRGAPLGTTARLGAGRHLTLDLTSLVPAGTESVALNVTALAPCSSGAVKVYPCGTPPVRADVEFAAGRTTSSLVISRLSTAPASGRVCVSTSATTDVLVDLSGAFVPGTGQLFHPVGPRRWVDTHGGASVVTLRGPLQPGAQLGVQFAGVSGVPADATAVWLNVTAAFATVDATLSVYPGACRSTPPTTTTVTTLGQRWASNAVLVGLGANGGVCVRSTGGPVHLVVELGGWFDERSTGGLMFRSAAPFTRLDTRGTHALAAQSTTTIAATGVGLYRVRLSGGTAAGKVNGRPCGALANGLLTTTAAGEVVSNLTVLAPRGAGWCLATTVATDAVIDQLGTFVPVPPR
jgi:hypothetical protein